jgi:hypothetical protein
MRLCHKYVLQQRELICKPHSIRPMVPANKQRHVMLAAVLHVQQQEIIPANPSHNFAAV